MYGKVGRFCFQHRRAVLLSWLVLFVVGIVVGSGVFSHLKDSNGAGSSRVVQGFNILDNASGTGPSAVAVVTGTRDDPATRAAVERRARRCPHCRT